MQAIIVGGGISGLSCAYFLHRAGIRTNLLETSARTGGVVETVRQDGYQFEAGPQSFLSNDDTDDLLASLQLQSEVQVANSNSPRFILLDGRLQKAPLLPPDLLRTHLISTRTKFKVFTEPFRKSHPPEEDESVAAFVRRKFGNDLLDNMVGPLVSGIHAGDPERLSLRSAFPLLYEWEREFGSVIKGAMKSRPKPGTGRPQLTSFRAGLATLLDSLATSLGPRVVTEAQVISIARREADGSRRFELRYRRHGQHESILADALVVATDARAAGELLNSFCPVAAEQLRAIEYAPVAVVGLGYRREQVSHPLQGFGFLVPRKENLSVLGTIWCSSLFAHRAPEGSVNLTSFVGGATQPDAVEKPEQDIILQVETEISRILGIRGRPQTQFVRRWPRALPQYNLGHASRLDTLNHELSRVPGLFLVGNYLSGPAIAACVKHARLTAAGIAAYLGASHLSQEPK